jgi:Fe-S-cluster containining protein
MSKVKCPPGIAEESWRKWIGDFEKSKTDPAPSLILMKTVSQMREGLNTLFFEASSWLPASFACLDLYWEYLDAMHKTDLPEMGCQRSGVCCMSQTPRVSLYEAHRIAAYFKTMPPETQAGIMERMNDVLHSKFTDARIGSGVCCPFLVKEKDTNKFACSIHAVRPMVCRMAGVTSIMGKTCKIWDVYKNKFPTLPPDIVRPFLDLFAYCRNTYAARFLHDQTRTQMVLLPVGVFMYLKIQLPKLDEVQDEEVLAVYSHPEGYSEELYLRSTASDNGTEGTESQTT